MARATNNGFDTSGFAGQYPRAFQLADGSSVELRVMSPDDRDAILGFARALPEEDLLFLRVDLTEADVVDAWVGNIGNGRMAALAAYRDDTFLGYAAVHRNPAPWMRHVGELRVNVAPAVRAQGLGRLLVSHVFDMAQDVRAAEARGADDHGSAWSTGGVSQAGVRPGSAVGGLRGGPERQAPGPGHDDVRRRGTDRPGGRAGAAVTTAAGGARGCGGSVPGCAPHSAPA